MERTPPAGSSPRDTAPTPSVADLLRRVSFLQQLDEPALRQLAQRTRRRRFPAGEALFHQGDPGQTLYLVLSGRVHIERITPGGETVHVAHLGPGEHFGELALIDGQPRMADAVTAAPCDLLMLDRADFLGCIEASPRIGLAVMASLAGRLREAAAHLESRQELGVRGRRAQARLDLVAAQEPGEPAGPVRLAGRVTHQGLADQIGATRESVSRAMAELRQGKAIRSEGRSLVVLSLPRLRRQSQL